jgi:hypothetical protein
MKRAKKERKPGIAWLGKPQKHDYPAAASYLALFFGRREVADLIKRLRKAKGASFKAKDLFRASELSLLGVSNSHVEADRARILAREPLSPVLLVRAPEFGKVVIADGYHRLCAVYSFDEDAEIPCRIV